MPHGMTILGETGLRFFGEMSAANAHEIKNALAVINENAGLLEDLVALTHKGIPLDPVRLRRLAEKIKQQVARADEIAKSTNRFAHSIDKAHGPSDLEQALLLIRTMAMRFATQRHIRINIVPCQPSIALQAPPFLLLHLLWRCLACAMQATHADETLEVVMQRTDGHARVRFGPLTSLDTAGFEALKTSPTTGALLGPLNGDVVTNTAMDEFVLIFKRPEAPDGKEPISSNQ